jgi:diacylglycerol O-acyltransferase
MSESSARRPVDPVDVLLLRQERDPRRRTIITVALCLDSAPEWAALVARVELAIRMDPKLRQRVLTPLRGAGPPEWVTDTDFDVRYHLRRARLPEPGNRAQLLEYAESLAPAPLDPRRPLWEAILVESGQDNTAALLIRLSHALVDGLAGVELLASLVDLQPCPVVDPLSVPDVADKQVTVLRLTVERVLAMPEQARARALRNAHETLRAATNILDNPRGQARAALGYARSLGRLLSPGRAAASPALRERSAARRFRTLEIPAQQLRRAARTVGGSLNDAYLAGVLGGLRHYHEALGLEVTEMPFAVPVSTRSRGEGSNDGAGNRFAPVRFAAPVGLGRSGRTDQGPECHRAGRTRRAGAGCDDHPGAGVGPVTFTDARPGRPSPGPTRRAGQLRARPARAGVSRRARGCPDLRSRPAARPSDHDRAAHLRQHLLHRLHHRPSLGH